MGQGLQGVRGQAMSGQRTTAPGVVIASAHLTGTSAAATGSITSPAAGTAYIWAFGAGGECNTGGSGAGGGGGASYRVRKVRRGDVFTLSAAAIPTVSGSDGGDSTVVCPDGVTVRGGGGKGGGSKSSGCLLLIAVGSGLMVASGAAGLALSMVAR